jgi:hypothetical protein
MASDDQRGQINMSSIPVAGVGGLGLVAVALVMAFVFPEARWLLTVGLIGGAALAIALVLARKHRDSRGGSSDPHVLFRPEATERVAPPRPDRTPHDLEQLSLDQARGYPEALEGLAVR